MLFRSDYQIRSAPQSTIRTHQAARIAVPDEGHTLIPRLILRTLRLNCLTNAYAPLWQELWDPTFLEDEWLLGGAYPEDRRIVRHVSQTLGLGTV